MRVSGEGVPGPALPNRGLATHGRHFRVGPDPQGPRPALVGAWSRPGPRPGVWRGGSAKTHTAPQEG
eukprot:scaffold1940_cov312-Prasinococcus_capsulatus_cf.AAC.2